MPSTAASWGSSFSSALGSPRSFPYEVLFSLTSTSSRTPDRASHSASASSSCGSRETKAPRKAGMAQNAHLRSQPLASLRLATGPLSSRRRRIGRRWAGVCSSTVAWPGTTTLADWRCTGVIGSSSRRSRGVWASKRSPASTPSSRAAMSV
jgi:hypothetical protein